MDLKRIMLADANFSCIPVLQSLLSADHHVSVCGSLASDPCHKLADNSSPIDYSNRDHLMAEVSELDIGYLVSGCNDVSYLSCAFVAEQLGLPGYDCYENVLTLHHKDKFRAFAESQGYPIPKAVPCPESVGGLAFPVLVKPVDSFSGRGISKVDSPEGLTDQFEKALEHSRSGNVVIEEFIEGTLHSHSAFIKDGRIVLDFFVDEYCTVYEYQVNSSCLSVELPDQLRDSVRTWCEDLSNKLSLVDGLVHTQFIRRGNEFWLVEVTRRCPGDLYSELIRRSTGVNYAELYAAPFIGTSVSNVDCQDSIKYCARHTVSSSKPCILLSTQINIPAAKNEFVSTLTVGNLLKKAPFGKSGIYFIEFASREELLRTTPHIREYVSVDGYKVEGS